MSVIESVDTQSNPSETAAESPYADLLQPKRRKRRSESETVEKITALADSPNQVKTTGWSADDIETLALGVTLLLHEATKTLSRKLVDDESLAMDDKESDIISKCLTRLIMRHIKIGKGKRGDVTDGAALLIALATYSLRVYDGVSEKRKGKQNAGSSQSSQV